MLCSSTEHGGQGDLSGQLLLPAEVCQLLPSLCRRTGNQRTVWDAKCFIPSPLGKCISSSIICPWLSLFSRCLGIEGDCSLLSPCVPLHWNPGRWAGSTVVEYLCQWLPSYTRPLIPLSFGLQHFILSDLQVDVCWLFLFNQTVPKMPL